MRSGARARRAAGRSKLAASNERPARRTARPLRPHRDSHHLAGIRAVARAARAAARGPDAESAGDAVRGSRAGQIERLPRGAAGAHAEYFIGARAHEPGESGTKSGAIHAVANPRAPRGAAPAIAAFRSVARA